MEPHVSLRKNQELTMKGGIIPTLGGTSGGFSLTFLMDSLIPKL